MDGVLSGYLMPLQQKVDIVVKGTLKAEQSALAQKKQLAQAEETLTALRQEINDLLNTLS
jgi:phosphoglycerate-specific signal transduction histidine kinase